MSRRPIQPTQPHRAGARAAALFRSGSLTPGGGWQLPPVSGRAAGSGGRWGLVLGGGGVVGAAWLIGALEALERVRGVDARDAELIIGTSAGSVIGALLAAGVSVRELRSGELERPGVSESGFDANRTPIQPAPPVTSRRQRYRPGSPSTLTTNAGHLRRMPPTAVLSGLLPIGRATMPAVHDLVQAMVPDGQWVSRDGLHLVAVDYRTGQRVVFGARGAPPAGLAEAVLASCSIPGWFAPVQIGGRQYVDGGTWSSSNLDLAAGFGLDEVIALIPMASFRLDSPVDWKARVERGWRRRVTRRTVLEAGTVYRSGTGVTVAGPGPAELELIGFDLMSPQARTAVLESASRTAGAALAPPSTGTTARPAVVDLTDAALNSALHPDLNPVSDPAAERG